MTALGAPRKGLGAMRGLLILTFGAAYAVSATSTAQASCAHVAPRKALAQADGAFVGTVGGGALGFQTKKANRSWTTGFFVERVVKGGIGDDVEVQMSFREGEPYLRTGDRNGWLLSQRGGKWFGDVCWEMNPDVMIQAAGIRFWDAESVTVGAALGFTLTIAVVLTIRLVKLRRAARSTS